MQEQHSHPTEEGTSSLAPPSLKPAKSKLIVTLGLLSVLGVPVILAIFLISGVFLIVAVISWLVTIILAIIAIVMGYKELHRIEKGITDSSQRKSTATGMWLGGLGSILLIFGVPILLSMYSSSEVSSFYKDPLIYDLNNLAAHAYQYRVRSIASAGGDGSYHGYVISPKFSKNEHGIYTAVILHADTIQFTARSILDSTLVIIVKIGPDGQPIHNSWIYLGNLE